MPNFGTSSRIRIGGQSMQSRQGMLISPVLNGEFDSKAPTCNADYTPSPAMYAYRNHDRDFIFQKICPPLYGQKGSIAHVTGLSANEPDFIADFHFIGLMRAIDDMCRHRYSGYIGGKFDSTGPA